jgi:PAS domain S-box-containing protein
LSAVSAALEESRGQREREQRDARATLEQTVAQAERAAREAEERHAQALAAAAAHRDDLQRQVEDALAQAAATRGAFERQLSDAAAALAQAQEQRAADAVAAADRLATREAELGTLLAEGATIRSALEARLDAVQLALRRAEQDAETERASASAREQAILGDLARETDARTGVARELGETRTEAARVRRRLLAAAAALRRRTHEQRARLEAEFAEERTGQERRLAAREEILRDVEVQRDTLLESLELTRGELQELHDRHDREREEFERIHSSRNSELQRVSAEYDQTRQSLDHLRDAFNTLERVSSEHALERARLEGVVTDREAQMSAQEAAHVAAQQAGQEALRQVEQTLRETVEARNHSIVRLERELQTVRQELERARTEGEALLKHAEQVPVLQQRLDASQQENRRQFEHAPHALYRVTRDGAIVAANRALAKILGCRTTDDLAKLDFAAAAFEAPADLRWLIDRAASGRSPESVETVWKKKDGTRLNIRLQVLQTTEDWIEVAAEDITELRTTEENLRQARHMEAVGRVASEVAVTCDTLLRGISRGGQYWLAAIGSDLGLRHQGEQILGDVAQATSLLQRLAAYGNEQSDALEPVHLQRVMRNLEPVLKRVVGDDIEVVLPKNIPPFSVDVERQRVERVLVTVASYARERMPHGGRLKIDLASTVVDRTFLDRYPSVRPGPHVIATITEERGATPVVPVSWPAGSADESTTTAGDKPGVDLSALVRLLGDCGGHLWVTAEPPGNMTLKIHLPLRPSDDATGPARSLARSGGGRSLGRWFRH